MNTLYKPSLVRLLLLCLFPVAVSAQYEIMSPQRLLQELEANIADARQLETAVNADLARKAQFQQEAEAVRTESTRYQQEKSAYDADLARHNAEVARYNKECGSGNYTEAELRQCEILQRSVERDQSALNDRRTRLEQSRVALRQRQENFNQRESQRAADAEGSLAEYETYNRNIDALMARLEQEDIFKNSNRDCFSRPSPEAALQCMNAVLGSR